MRNTYQQPPVSPSPLVPGLADRAGGRGVRGRGRGLHAAPAMARQGGLVRHERTRQDGKRQHHLRPAARHVRLHLRAEARAGAHRADAAGSAARGRLGGGQSFLHPQRQRLPRDATRGAEEPAFQPHPPGREHDHPATRAQHVSAQGADLRAQDPGNLRRAPHRDDADEGPDHGVLPQPHLSRAAACTGWRRRPRGTSASRRAI